MSILPYLSQQIRLHPSMTPQDLAKLCYQAARGAEHLLADPEQARAYLLRELEATEADPTIPLVEPISDTVARVNLAPWKARGLSAELLFEIFAATATVSHAGEDLLPLYLEQTGEFLAQTESAVSLSDWQTFLARYREQGCPAIHHSPAYREAERPAYRILRRDRLADAGIHG